MENDRINIWWLSIGGTVLLAVGFYMKAFPIFVFIGLAPFFAILDHTMDGDHFWEHAELILIGLAIALFAAFQFDATFVITILFLAILFTLPFIGFAFAHENLGPRTGKFIVIILWLGLEYVLVKLQWPRHVFHLADSLQAWPAWVRWNTTTGYLGASAWILLTNWLVYAAVLRQGIRWPLVILALTIWIGPMIYSYTLPAQTITRHTMLELYNNKVVSSGNYAATGELVARTSAWVSILVLVFAGVKSRTSV
jgi:hypothetical protein